MRTKEKLCVDLGKAVLDKFGADSYSEFYVKQNRSTLEPDDAINFATGMLKFWKGGKSREKVAREVALLAYCALIKAKKETES